MIQQAKLLRGVRGGRARGSFFAVVVALAALLATPAQTASTTVIHVDDDALAGGDGSGRFPYDNLTDALARARTASGAVAINVAPGDYAIDSSLVIDRPLELRGSSVLEQDDDGWPTGAVAAGTETRIRGTATLGTQPLLDVGRSDAVVIEDVGIRGFVFEGTLGGIEVLVRRVQDYAIQDNVFRAPGFLGLQTVASSGRVAGNYFSGVDTGAILAGGYPASPSKVTFTGNRSVHNNLGGVLLNGASIRIPGARRPARGGRSRQRSEQQHQVAKRRFRRSFVHPSAGSRRSRGLTIHREHPRAAPGQPDRREPIRDCRRRRLPVPPRRHDLRPAGLLRFRSI